MRQPSERASRAYRSEWTALFLVAAELTRRGYTVAFTMGDRTPVADLMAGSPVTGKQFWIDVKGVTERQAWFVREKADRENLFYIFASVSTERTKDRFFILSQPQTKELITAHKAAHPKWFRLPIASDFENCWDIIP